MKTINRLFASIALIVGTFTAASAQNGLSIHAGNNFPIGAFSRGNTVGDIALNNSNSSYGGAAMGFNAGAKFQLSVLSDLSAFVSADFFYNGLKKELKEGFNDHSKSPPSYMNMPVMAGINYTLFEILGTTFWAEAGAGMNFRNITNNVSLSLDANTIGVSTEEAYDLTCSLAWKAGIGATLASKLSLGIHYYGFGASDISGETTSTLNVGSLTSEMKDSFTGGKLKAAMIVVRLGYHF
ncbi:MAG: hypothetical protein J6V12_07420 [Bacteroidaceae bacterium]|nr:hypothetical protein [Bacteroidaceae bacterium]